MTRYDEERIARLLGALPVVPQGWVQAAQELPFARRELDSIVDRAARDADYRAAVVADMEAALRTVGVEPSTPVVAHLRRRLEQ